MSSHIQSAESASTSSARPASGVTESLARFVSASAEERLPQAVSHATGRLVANWFGCAAGAVRDASLESVIRVALGLRGAEQASIIGRHERLDVVNAALINGFAANALDFDDMHVGTLIHPTG